MFILLVVIFFSTLKQLLFKINEMTAMVTMSLSLWVLPFTSTSLSQVIGFQIKSVLLPIGEVATPPGRQDPALHQPALVTCLAWPCVWLVLPMIMALAGSSVSHGSESRKGILNYRGEMMLKKETVYRCLFFFPHSEIFSYSLSFNSIKYGWLHFLRKCISLQSESWWNYPRRLLKKIYLSTAFFTEHVTE